MSSQIALAAYQGEDQFQDTNVQYIYKCLNGTAPTNLTSSLSLYRSTRAGLRSASDTTRLTFPRTVRTQICRKPLFHPCCPSFVEQPASYYQRVQVCHNLSKTFENSSVSKAPLVAINFVSCFSCCYIIVSMYFLCLMRYDLDGAALYKCL